MDVTASGQSYGGGSTVTHASMANTQKSELEGEKSELQGLIVVAKELISSFTSAMKQVQHPASASVQQALNDQQQLPKRPPRPQTPKAVLEQNYFTQTQHGQGVPNYQHANVTPNPHGYPQEDYNRISPHYQHANHYQHTYCSPQPNFYQHALHPNRPELHVPGGLFDTGRRHADILSARQRKFRKRGTALSIPPHSARERGSC